MKARLPFVVFLASLHAMSQTVPIQGPVSGVLYDPPSRSVRPLIGFPGSSYLGKAALGELDNAFIAPDGESALIVERGQATLIQGLAGGNATRFPFNPPIGQVDAVSWASNSTSLMVYSASARILLCFDARTSGPVLRSSVDLSSLEGDVVSVVTNDDASHTVIGVRHPVKGGLYAVLPEASVLLLSPAAEPGPAIFRPSTNSLYAVDLTTRRILYFESIRGNPEVLSFSSESDLLADPVGLAFSADGQRLFLAGGSDQIIREYDISSRTMLLAIPLDLVPRRLSPLARIPSVFVLSVRSSREQPVWLLDTRTSRSVSFAPAGE